MPTRHDRTPLSDRVAAALTGDDPTLIREIEALERIASAGVARVAANGKWPHWPLDRWITVLGFLGVIVAGVFTAGNRWSGVERDIEILNRTVLRIEESIRADRDEMRSLRALIVNGEVVSMRQSATPRQAERPTPLFGADSHLDLTTGKDAP